MATGTRLRFNFIEGNLSSTIDDSQTSIESDAFSDLPVIDHSSDGGFAVAVIAASEIVHIVSHAAASNEATVERGQEGTAAQAHASGSTVRHGSTAEDFNVAAASALIYSIALGE